MLSSWKSVTVRRRTSKFVIRSENLVDHNCCFTGSQSNSGYQPLKQFDRGSSYVHWCSWCVTHRELVHSKLIFGALGF